MATEKDALTAIKVLAVKAENAMVSRMTLLTIIVRRVILLTMAFSAFTARTLIAARASFSVAMALFEWDDFPNCLSHDDTGQRGGC